MPRPTGPGTRDSESQGDEGLEAVDPTEESGHRESNVGLDMPGYSSDGRVRNRVGSSLGEYAGGRAVQSARDDGAHQLDRDVRAPGCSEDIQHAPPSKATGQDGLLGRTLRRSQNGIKVQNANVRVAKTSVRPGLPQDTPSARIHPVGSKNMGGRAIAEDHQGRLARFLKSIRENREGIWTAHGGPLRGKPQCKVGAVPQSTTRSIIRGRERAVRSMEQRKQLGMLPIRPHSSHPGQAGSGQGKSYDGRAHLARTTVVEPHEGPQGGRFRHRRWGAALRAGRERNHRGTVQESEVEVPGSQAGRYKTELAAERRGAGDGKRLFFASLNDKTAAHYAASWQSFKSFFSHAMVRSLPSSTRTVLAFMDYRLDHRPVAVATLKPIFASINTMHAAHGYRRPARGPQKRQAENGYARLLADTGRSPLLRPYVPAWVICKIADFSFRNARFQHRAAAIVLTYICFTRAEYIRNLKGGDIVFTATGFSVTIWHRKAAAGARAALAPVIVNWDATRPGIILDLVRAAFAGRNDPNIFLLSHTSAPATHTLRTWFAVLLQEAGIRPPGRGRWLFHGLRKGAASDAYAARVPLRTIMALGGWREQKTLERSYLDRSSPASMGAREIFSCWSR